MNSHYYKILFHRLDEKDNSASAYRWVMISWSPDAASVRNKMLYASTKATLKQAFGGSQVKQDVYANTRVKLLATNHPVFCRQNAVIDSLNPL